MKNTAIVILSLLSFLYVLIGSFTDTVTFDTLKVMGAFGIFQLTISVYSYLRTKQPLISPYIAFIVCLYIFSFGQSLLYPFDLVGSRDLVGFRGITIEKVFRGQIITLIFLAFFHIGALLKGKSKNLGELYTNIVNKQNNRLKQIAWFVLIISIYPYYNEIITNAIISLTRGYVAIYGQELKTGIGNASGILADYFIPALIVLYIAYRDKRRWRLFILGVFIFNGIILLVTGGRSDAVIMVAMLLILHNYLVKAFTKKGIMIIAGCCFGLLIILATIGRVRGDEHRTLQEIAQTETDDNAAVEVISEMGWSMFCLIQTEGIVPENENFRFGSTYALSFTSIIPNLEFWEIHPAKEGANMSDWLTDKLNMGYGTGFSMCAEAYINFGYFGALMMMLLGYIINAFFGNLAFAIKTKNIAFIAFILITFWFSLKMPRNSFIGIVRGVFYYALPIYWYSRGYIIKRR